MVKVIEIDSQGRINLSRKAVLAGADPNADYTVSNRGNGAPPSRDRGGPGGGGGRRRRD